MEHLSESLQPYKDIVGSVASVVTIGQFLAGSVICKDIYVKGGTKDISSDPFVGGIGIGVLMLQYAYILDDSAMLVVNFAAIFLNVLYLLFYFYYTATKYKVVKNVTLVALFVGALLVYSKMEAEDQVEYRFGLVVTVLMLTLIGSPLLGVKSVIQEKDSTSIPFPIVLCGTVVSFLWLVYGIILLNNFMVFQNLIGLVLCAVQLALCIVYPAGKGTKVD